MYLGVDVGGTKTLLAVFDSDGKVIFEHKIVTNKSYPKFLEQIRKAANSELKPFDLREICVAIPARVDRRRGLGLDFGNLVWHNVPIKDNFSKILKGLPVLVENDANLAGLSEAKLVLKKYKKTLYLTVSTGIGGGIIINGKLDPDFLDFEPGQMVIFHEGKLQTWEDFASGKALKKRYGKIAADLKDATSWRGYSADLAVGLQELLAVVQPKLVIIGGGVGSHFEKFSAYLEGELQKLENPLVPIPPIIKAHRPEEAVIYGCYDFIRQNS